MRRSTLPLARCAATALALLLAASAAHAGSAWDEIRAGVFAGRTIEPRRR